METSFHIHAEFGPKNSTKWRDTWQSEKIIESVPYCNHERLHESLDNMPPADVYFGRYRQIQELRDMVKEQTLEQR